MGMQKPQFDPNLRIGVDKSEEKPFAKVRFIPDSKKKFQDLFDKKKNAGKEGADEEFSSLLEGGPLSALNPGQEEVGEKPPASIFDLSAKAVKEPKIAPTSLPTSLADSLASEAKKEALLIDKGPASTSIFNMASNKPLQKKGSDSLVSTPSFSHSLATSAEQASAGKASPEPLLPNSEEQNLTDPELNLALDAHLDSAALTRNKKSSPKPKSNSDLPSQSSLEAKQSALLSQAKEDALAQSSAKKESKQGLFDLQANQMASKKKAKADRLFDERSEKSELGTLQSAKNSLAPDAKASKSLAGAPIAAVSNSKNLSSLKEAIALVEQINGHLLTLELNDRQESTFIIQHPPLFQGASVTLTEHRWAQKEFNLSFCNLSAMAQRQIEQSSEALKIALQAKGIFVHNITASIDPYPYLPHLSLELSSDTDDGHPQQGHHFSQGQEQKGR